MNKSDGWFETGHIDWNVSNSDLDGFGLLMQGTASISRTISTIGYQSIRLVIGMYLYISFYLRTETIENKYLHIFRCTRIWFGNR